MTEQITPNLLVENRDKTSLLIVVFFKRLLWEWGKQLADRPENVRLSSQGKFDSVIHRQTTEYLNNFFNKLKTKTLASDVLERVVQICDFMQQREYVKANDIYLRLSIGNAAWPIGVTMVGIHERSAREKIHASQVAHVLNDEATRKYIQSIKRLITFCQSIYPPDDMAKRVG